MQPSAWLGMLARDLKTLAAPTRLELLHVLREPRALHEIRAHPSQTQGDVRRDRPLTRQAVSLHLDRLMEAGLVRRDPRTERFVIDRSRIFALVDGLRQLVHLQAPGGPDPDATIFVAADAPPALAARPRLLVAYGVDAGAAHPLYGPGPWIVGRSGESAVRLREDPYVSSRHCSLERRHGQYHVVPHRSRNGTWIDGVRLAEERPTPLQPGDMLVVGRSHLVLQP